MKRRRGGALIYVLLMTLATGGIVMAMVNASATGHIAEIRDEQKAMAHAAFQGAVDQFAAECAAGTLTVPTVRTLPIGKVSGVYTITNNGATLPGSYLVDAVLTVKGKTYRESQVIGRKGPLNVFYYVLFSNTSVTSAQPVVTNGPNWAGDVSINGNLTLNHTLSQINGDVETTGQIFPASLSVTGTKMQNASPISFPVLPYILLPLLNPYLIEAVLQLPGLIISGLNLGTGYPIAFALLASQIRGTYTGKGTIYFPGDVTVIDDIYYGSPTSRISVIAFGNITVAGNVTHLAGHWYAGGTMTFLGPSAKVLDTGSIVASSVSIQAPLTLNHDPAIWQDPTEAYRLKLPGYWP